MSFHIALKQTKVSKTKYKYDENDKITFGS